MLVFIQESCTKRSFLQDGNTRRVIDMDQKKILMVYHEPTPYIRNLIISLEKIHGKKISVLFLNSCFSQQWNVPFEDSWFIFSKKNLKEILISIIRRKYSVIFLAGWSNPITIMMLFLSRLFHIPAIVDSDTPMLPHVPLTKRIIKRMLYPILFILPNLFLPSGTRQAQYLKHYFVPDKKIILEKMTVDVLSIQNAIYQFSENDRDNFRAKFNIEKKDTIFLFIGRLIERKGIVELIKAFSKIENKTVKCMIVGDGPLKSLVTEASRNNNNIIYAGWLNETEIINSYFLADIFILPAHWEPWGLVINEAMAAGKPVIATNQVGCVDDLVMHHQTGFIIEPNSVDAIAESVNYFLENPDKINKMSCNALALITHWTIEDSAKQIKLAFDHLISN